MGPDTLFALKTSVYHSTLQEGNVKILEVHLRHIAVSCLLVQKLAHRPCEMQLTLYLRPPGSLYNLCRQADSHFLCCFRREWSQITVFRKVVLIVKDEFIITIWKALKIHQINLASIIKIFW